MPKQLCHLAYELQFFLNLSYIYIYIILTFNVEMLFTGQNRCRVRHCVILEAFWVIYQYEFNILFVLYIYYEKLKQFSYKILKSKHI